MRIFFWFLLICWQLTVKIGNFQTRSAWVLSLGSPWSRNRKNSPRFSRNLSFLLREFLTLAPPNKTLQFCGTKVRTSNNESRYATALSTISQINNSPRTYFRVKRPLFFAENHWVDSVISALAKILLISSFPTFIIIVIKKYL